MGAARSLNVYTPLNRVFMSLIVSGFIFSMAPSPTQAVTPEEAFAKGCGGCHASERKILRRIPKGSDIERRTWILNFMASHPNERDSLKPEILEYLVGKSSTSKSWWQF